MAVSSVSAIDIASPANRARLLWALWILAAIIGGLGFLERLLHGDQGTDFSSYIPWGLWVAAYIYFSGLSAGAFLLAAAIYVFRIRVLEPISRLALLLAAVTLPMGLLMIGFDLGHLERAYLVIIRPQFHSMMAWMVWLYTTYLILVVVMLWLSYKSDQPGRDPEAVTKDRARLRVLALIGIPLAIGFAGGVGALFATLAAREFWHSSLFPIFFLVGALTSGTALVTAVVAWQWPSHDAAWKDLMTLLGRTVLVLILIDLILELAEFMTPSWYQIGSFYELTRYVLFGPYWYVFWLVHLLLGVIVPIVLLAKNRSPIITGVAAALVAVTFFAVRLNLVIPGLVTPELRGLEQAYRDPIGNRLTFAYFPTWFEWQVLLGAIAFGVALWYVLIRLFPQVLPSPAQSSEVGQ
ncbi:MAG: polysulfide reductase NrfD [Deltaproteobacteria bacterium]|nr:polysulfide reductase NrfD [Deltaproteobacteria bacterium]